MIQEAARQGGTHIDACRCCRAALFLGLLHQTFEGFHLIVTPLQNEAKILPLFLLVHLCCTATLEACIIADKLINWVYIMVEITMVN
jgi:hypothetical protein